MSDSPAPVRMDDPECVLFAFHVGLCKACQRLQMCEDGSRLCAPITKRMADYIDWTIEEELFAGEMNKQVGRGEG
jgi:hypothetical protein